MQKKYNYFLVFIIDLGNIFFIIFYKHYIFIFCKNKRTLRRCIVQKHLDFIIEMAKSAILAIFVSFVALIILSFLNIPFEILMELLKIEIVIEKQGIIWGQVVYLVIFVYLALKDYNDIYN